MKRIMLKGLLVLATVGSLVVPQSSFARQVPDGPSGPGTVAAGDGSGGYNPCTCLCMKVFGKQVCICVCG